MFSSQSPIQYVFDPSFLSSVVNTFDTVMFADYIIDDAIKAMSPKIIDRKDTQMGFGLGGILHQYITNYDKVLLVVYHTPIIYLYPLIQALQKSGDTQVSILNLGTGVSGLIHKGQPEMDDVGLMYTLGIGAREVIACNQLYDAITRFDTQILYTRLVDLEILPEIDIVWKPGYHSIMSSGSASKTILCSAQLAGLVMSSIGEEKMDQVDMIVMMTHFTDRDEQVIASVQATKQLTIMLDAHHRQLALTHAQAQCYLHHLGDVGIHVLCADTTKHHTILSEYFWQEVQFS